MENGCLLITINFGTYSYSISPMAGASSCRNFCFLC